MSGFFFCGNMDEPVANASDSWTKPNSSVDHSTISSPMRDKCTCTSAATNNASATKSRSETASSELSKVHRELELVRDRRGIERQTGPRERTSTQRRHVRAGHAVAPTIDIARKRPEMRKQMVREQHGLRALQMRVARQRDLVRVLGALEQYALQRVDTPHLRAAFAAKEQP